jgi:hypothetical protein
VAISNHCFDDGAPEIQDIPCRVYSDENVH